MTENSTNKASTHSFGTEVNQLLKLMINALYSNREIFLRELISNASDASDKLRFASLTDEALKGLDQNLSIQVSFDPEKKLLCVEDHGIGMSRDEVIENLGTIARSGTRHFLDQLSGDMKKDANLIGQFGVGFYSAFIVADEVVVETRRAGVVADQAIRWSSAGEGEYQIEPITKDTHGTRVTLHVSPNHHDLLSKWQLQRIIRHYSNHIAFPIELVTSSEKSDDADQESGASVEVVNEAKALWARPKAEIKDDEYEAFYRSISHDISPPLSWAHHQVEGTQSYSMLLYLPKQAPFDLMVNRDVVEGLKLYIQRVFIMDAAEQLLPRYLRFMRGVVDSADLPLNVSREILQDSPLLKKIRATVIKRSLDLIDKVTEQGGEEWNQFWDAFGSILKEGVIEDFENKERVAQLLRFASSEQEGVVGLDDYIGRIKDDKKTIWYLTAESLQVARHSPHLESFKKKGIEVLLLTDRIDEWLVSHLHDYKGFELKSVATGSVDGEDAPKPKKESLKLAGRIKKVLGDSVGNVKPTDRLTDSAARVVMDENQMSLQMQKLMRQAGQAIPETVPSLEINPAHPIVQLMDSQDDDRFAELSHLLFDQALLAEGGELADPSAYVKRVNQLLVSALGTASN
jgi:molecular chaperone HtpG